MKFAKELESDLVPEWRVKYLDYKAGKKKLKAVSRALRQVERTPLTGGRRESSAPFATFGQAPFYAFLNRPTTKTTDRRASSGDVGATSVTVPGTAGHGTAKRSAAMSIPGSRNAETTPLQQAHDGRHMTRYGSILGTPPDDPDTKPMPIRRSEDATSLRLPGPALGSTSPAHPKAQRLVRQQTSGSAYHVGDDTSRPLATFALPPRYRSIFHPRRVNSMSGVQDVPPTRPPTKRQFSMYGSGTHADQDDIALNAYREVDARQFEFFMFLDQEMDKIEDFYKSKEDEATERLKVLREQLHIMRDQRVEEIFYASSSQAKRPSQGTETLASNGLVSRNSTMNGDDSQLIKKDPLHPKNLWYKPGRKKAQQPSKTFQAMKELGTPSGPRPHEDRRDYVRKGTNDVSYHTAKRKLKIALAEYYRGLELLKSYALLNRTAFRKINKKFDKTVNARPSGRYMSEKVNTAYFVNSTVLDGHIQAVEDLYARYFERGNHKIAVGKLRAKAARAGDYTGSVFRNGIILAIGTVFGVEGLVYAIQKLYDADPTVSVNTSYLLQIYGGYFMMWLLSILFCLACRTWQRSKVNYAFVFEFDTRHHVDWRQLSEIPSILGLCLGLTMWLNFSHFASESFYVYWPVVLVGVSAVILFNPFPFFYHRSRFWFLYTNWRLMLSGVYPVEFRDFFLGDMFCSQTYALGNIELFFCLYRFEWVNPPQCNSSHSRLLGFFATLPGIWRALQCLRRYHDTKNVFPHLVNCGKYACTILYYMSLSLYRLDKNNSLRGFFIFCATINALYCSVWDIVMDWSLMDPYAKHPFLRSTLGFKHAWWYYAAMVIDPIIRFNWIFYAIYVKDVQHSTIVSFLVGFSEIFRRGIWTLFRVENEHCTNVGRFRASRDVPLPYEVSNEHEEAIEEAQVRASDVEAQQQTPTSVQATGADTERRASQVSGEGASVRLRKKTVTGQAPSPLTRAFTRVGTMLHTAHAQDFERRRRPETGKSGSNGPEEDEDDDDDDDSDDDARVLENQEALENGQIFQNEEALENGETDRQTQVEEAVHGTAEGYDSGDEDEGEGEAESSAGPAGDGDLEAARAARRG